MGKKIIDLAKIAGVSPATVSLVYSGSPLVAKKTREKVMKAGSRHGYFPNQAARAVRQGKFNRIAGVVVQYGPRGMGYSPNNGYLDAAANELAEHGYSLVLEPLHLNLLNDDFLEPPKLFTEMAVDGIMGLPASGIVPPKVDAQLGQLGAPTVWMNRNREEAPDSVVADEKANAELLVRHLIELGHRRIGYAWSETPHYSSRQRYEGVVEELISAGLDTEWVLKGNRAGCRFEMAERMLDMNPRPTAVACYHRSTYDAMLHTAARRGIRVPEELSICYFASEWEMAIQDYRATAMVIPESKMAVTAVRRLLDVMAGRIPEGGAAPIVGKFEPGWTTSRPGEAWAPGVERCRHEDAVCIYRQRMEGWKDL